MLPPDPTSNLPSKARSDESKQRDDVLAAIE